MPEKLFNYKWTSRIPPEANPGRNSSFIQTVDVAPTILDFLGVGEGTDAMQGKSLMPFFRGKAGKVRDFAISGYFNFSWSIITDDWSYIHWLDEKDLTDPRKVMALFGFTPMKEKKEVWTCTPGSEAETPKMNELYDRTTDRYQLNNILGEHPETARMMHDRLLEFMLRLRTDPDRGDL